MVGRKPIKLSHSVFSKLHTLLINFLCPFSGNYLLCPSSPHTKDTLTFLFAPTSTQNKHGHRKFWHRNSFPGKYGIFLRLMDHSFLNKSTFTYLQYFQGAPPPWRQLTKPTLSPQNTQSNTLSLGSNIEYWNSPTHNNYFHCLNSEKPRKYKTISDCAVVRLQKKQKTKRKKPTSFLKCLNYRESTKR